MFSLSVIDCGKVNKNLSGRYSDESFVRNRRKDIISEGIRNISNVKVFYEDAPDTITVIGYKDGVSVELRVTITNEPSLLKKLLG